MSNFKYFPHTEEDLREMMDTIGITSLQQLYDDVPEAVRFKGDYQLPAAMSEQELRQ